MGTVKEIKGADYSNNPAGYYDKAQGVVRRAINGALERNKFSWQNNWGASQYPFALNQDIYSFNVNFFRESQPDMSVHFVAVADYTRKVWVRVNVNITGTGVATLRVNVFNGTTGYQDTAALGTLVSTTQENKLNITINFADRRLVSATFNGTARAITRGSLVTNPSIFDGKVDTLNIGQGVLDTSNSTYAASLINMSDQYGNSVFNFDFLGVNENEKLTDKTGLVQLLKAGAPTLISVPLPFSEV